MNAAIIGAVLLSISTVDSFRIAPMRNSGAILGIREIGVRQNMAKDKYQSMEVDESKLSPSEVERLAFIRKLTMEADEIIKAAGLSLEDEELDEKMVQRSVKDTDWSGQSDVEESIRSKNNWSDVTTRKVLAITDISALVTSAAVTRSYLGESVDVIGTLGSSIPFIATWFLLSPFLGTFSRESTESKEGVPKGLLLGWILCTPLTTAALEFLKEVKSTVPSLIFTQISVFVCLAIWRVIYISLIGETSEKEYKSAGFFEVFKMIKSLVKRW